MSAGFCVSVGCPVTSPGFEDIPGSFAGPLASSVGLGLAGRETLPALPVSVEEPALPRVSLAEPLWLEPVSVPEVVGFDGEAGVAGLAFVSSAGGVSEGKVRVRCIELESLRPCDFLWCFFAFLPLFELGLEIDSFELPCADDPLLTLPELSFPTPVLVDAPLRLGTALEEVSRFEELSGCSCVLFTPVSPAEVELAAGLLLGSELLLDEVFDESPGRALLFWSAGRVAVPLSSVDWLFGVEVVLVLLVPVPVLVCARAPNAERAKASAAIPMIFMEPPLAVLETLAIGARLSNRRGHARTKREEEGGRSPPSSPTYRQKQERSAQALKLDPHPHVCFAFGFLKLNPLCPNWPST